MSIELLREPYVNRTANKIFVRFCKAEDWEAAWTNKTVQQISSDNDGVIVNLFRASDSTVIGVEVIG